ncbi:MAG: TerB family tellurite resistance protein [Proteobacteria bacterium]|nr:TerB family tellurite resistance protein [Pseudomonadota bacterium]
MFDLIKNIIKKPDPKEPVKNNSAERTQIAASVLLLEAAQVDNECTQEEMDHVIETLKTQFGLTDDYTQELIELAHQERNDAIDLWQYTNQINKQYSKEEKLAVMEAVWRIIHADGHLEMHEDHFAHKLANLLRLTHNDLIECKIRAKEQIAN